MEIWVEIRRRVLTGEISKRQACVEYEIHWRTLTKILSHEEPPGFRAKAPRAKPKLGPFLPIIHEILDADRTAPKKQRHTAERIFQRLRDEHGYTGCASIVRAAVAEWKQGPGQGVLTPGPPAGGSPGRLRPGRGGDRRRAGHGRVLRDDLAPLGRVL